MTLQSHSSHHRSRSSSIGWWCLSWVAKATYRSSDMPHYVDIMELTCKWGLLKQFFISFKMPFSAWPVHKSGWLKVMGQCSHTHSGAAEQGEQLLPQVYQWGSNASPTAHRHYFHDFVYTEQPKSIIYACCEELTVNANLLQSESARSRQRSFLLHKQPF